jgi:hypothetical protein
MEAAINFEMEQTFYQGFESAYRDAGRYRFRVGKFQAEPDPSHELVFNVASLAMESYLVALCQLHRIRPFNHNFVCLTDTLKDAVALPDDVARDIRALDEIFGICSLDEYYHGTPDPEDALRLVALCDKVAALFDGESERIAAQRAQFGAKLAGRDVRAD